MNNFREYTNEELNSVNLADQLSKLKYDAERKIKENKEIRERREQCLNIIEDFLRDEKKMETIEKVRKFGVDLSFIKDINREEFLEGNKVSSEFQERINIELKKLVLRLNELNK